MISEREKMFNEEKRNYVTLDDCLVKKVSEVNFHENKIGPSEVSVVFDDPISVDLSGENIGVFGETSVSIKLQSIEVDYY